ETKPIRIAIDYDGTLTRFPVVLVNLMEGMRHHHAGVEIYIVTMRYENEPITALFDSLVDRVIYTGRKAKLLYCRDVLGITFDLWVDDRPDFLYNNAAPT